MAPPHLESVLPEPVEVEVHGRGTIRAWDTGPPGEAFDDAPVLLLLHGWNVDAPLTYGATLDILRRRYRAIMFDLHGHGAGVRTTSPFRLEHCVTDALAVMDALDIDRFFAIGFSLGGSVAQLLGRRAPTRCDGLVLAASATTFGASRAERAQFAVLRHGARLMRRLPRSARQTVFERIAARECRRYPEWVLDTVLAADPVALLEAGAEIGAFDSSTWIHTLDLPTTVVVTERDTIVPPERQRTLASHITTSSMLSVDSDHDLPVRDVERFGDVLVQAVERVTAGRPEPILA